MDSMKGDIRDFAEVLNKMDESTAMPDSVVYRCPICRDTGWILTDDYARPCVCRQKAEMERKKQNAGLPPKLSRCSFNSFNLSFYSRELLPEGRVSYHDLAKRAVDTCSCFVGRVLEGDCSTGLLLTGNAGSGKTHLAASVANQLLQQGKDVLFLVVPEFLDQLRNSYRRENEGLDEAELVKRAYDASVLILDDLGAHDFTPWVQSKLFTIINYRINHDLPCVVTTNLDVEALKDSVGERVFSRLMEGCHFLQLSVAKDIRFALRTRDLR